MRPCLYRCQMWFYNLLYYVVTIFNFHAVRLLFVIISLLLPNFIFYLSCVPGVVFSLSHSVWNESYYLWRFFAILILKTKHMITPNSLPVISLRSYATVTHSFVQSILYSVILHLYYMWLLFDYVHYLSNNCKFVAMVEIFSRGLHIITEIELNKCIILFFVDLVYFS